MDTQRIIALIVFSFSGMLLWQAWQKQHTPAISPPSIMTTPQVSTTGVGDRSIPVPQTATASDPLSPPPLKTVAETVKTGKRVTVQTNKLVVELDTAGADIRMVTLRDHLSVVHKTQPLTLLQDNPEHYFITQSGLLGPGLPTHQAMWSIDQTQYELGSQNALEVRFTSVDTPGVSVDKIYTFKRDSYLIEVRYEIKNESGETLNPNAYFQFVRDSNPPEGENAGSNPFTGVVTFTGPAVYTEAKKFQKISFTDIDKEKQDHIKTASDGWIALVQHYFVSAWLPDDKAKLKREFFTRKVSDNLYSAGVIVPVGPIASGATAKISMPLYIGPQEQEKLKKIRTGLDLVVDYGWLTVLAYPMFVILSWINGLVGNWGWTIIIFTILIKIVFFPLNQRAGKSMARMKALAPKVEALRARVGDDKMKLNQAMMELYRNEKVNPLGGCLPMVIQIPFFIALYWVLLGAVELRNAPWLGWIHDLSSPDPLYVLPVIMGASMLIQTKLNPAPPDPVQAKIMMIMPVIFSVMFFFFPAGLVLYWTVQNILGIAQQWYINKTFSEVAPKVPKR